MMKNMEIEYEKMKSIEDISIALIIPIYNVEKYLKQCLESVVQQIVSFNEVVLINDGSTDNSLEICKNYAFEYKYFKLISQENRGLSVARNIGIYNTTSQYIMFLDSDDYLRLDTVKILKTQLQKMQYDAIFFDAEIWCESVSNMISRNVYDRSHARLDGRQMSGWEYFSKCYPRNYVVSACLAVYKKSLIINFGINFPENLFYEDNYFTFMFIKYAECVIHISDKLYQRRFRENSITTSKISEKKFVDYIKVSSLIWQKIIMRKYKYLTNSKELLLAFISDYFIRSLDNYHMCIDQKIILRTEVYNILKRMAKDYFLCLKELHVDISILDLSMLTRLVYIDYHIKYWQLVADADISYSIQKVAKMLKQLYTKLLKGLPLNKKEYFIGIYGTGKHTEGLFSIYEKLVGSLSCNLVFIDSQKNSGIYKNSKLINYQDITNYNFDLIVVSSFIYEEEMIYNIKEMKSVVPIYTFYEKLRGDVFSNYRIFLEYFKEYPF